MTVPTALTAMILGSVSSVGNSMLRLVVVTVSMMVMSTARAQPYSPRITSEEVALYVRWLRADAEQAAVIYALHAEHLRARDDTFLEELRALNKRHSTLLTALASEDSDRVVLYRTEYDPLMKEYEAIDERLRIVENDFFERMRGVLRNDQLSRWWRVAGGRERMVLTQRANELPEGRVDLIAMLDGMALDEAAYDVIERDFISAFEPRRIALLRESVEQARKRQHGYREVYELEQAGAREPYERQSVILRRITELKERLGRTRIAAAEAVVRLNREGRAELLQVLPDAVRAEFESRYDEIAYPEVFPDGLNAARLFTAALAFENLSDDQRGSVEALRDLYVREHTRLCSEMADRIHHRVWCAFADRPSPRGDLNAMWTDLFALGAKREALDLKQADILAPILPPAQIALLPDWTFEPHEIPRPWDHRYESARQHLLEQMHYRNAHDTTGGAGGS